MTAHKRYKIERKVSLSLNLSLCIPRYKQSVARFTVYIVYINC